MLSEQCIKDLNVLMNGILSVGTQFKAAYRDMMDYRGISAKLKKEAMERWDIASMVADFIQYGGGDVVYSQRPAPKHGKDPSVFDTIMSLEGGLIENLKKMINSAADRKSYGTMVFMSKILETLMMEHSQITRITKRVKNNLNNLAALDTAFYMEYLEENEEEED